jgi:signal transduction histidine kinase
LPRGASRRLIAAFVLLLLLPAAAVVWLGVRLIVQDRQLESEQLRTERESVANRVVEALDTQLAGADRNLDSMGPPGDDAVIFVLKSDGVETRPRTPLLYRPGLAAGGDPLPAFTAGEELEYRRGDLDAAESAWRKLAGDRSPEVRAGALVRLARVLRRKGRIGEALRVYDELTRLRAARVDGVPAELVARRARARILDELKDIARLRDEAGALRAGLLSGAWEIDRGTFDQYLDETASWLDAPAVAPSVPQAFAEAAELLWARRGTSGRSAERLAGVDLALLWRSAGGETVALAAGPAFQQRHWFSALQTASGDGDISVSLATAAATFNPWLPASAGRSFTVVREEGDAATLRRAASETRLPWDVLVSTSATSSIGSNRRLAILIGLGFLVLLVIAGGYVVGRAVSRELAVARLQSDFVASVSHEFRTPLTSLRQFTDLLNEADDLSPDKRRRFYAAQSRATERLQRLVESLLDFRRMEAGTHPYQRRRLPASPFVETVVDDFRAEAAERGFDVEYTRGGEERTIDADPDALSLALWNLLDNAVKYSGGSRRVSVSTSAQNGSVQISVRDRGIGVPPEEQQEIFRQFVRGREARDRGIKGTGIGLAMVQHIVQGHGGRVALESEPGAGSTFTIVLPAVD